MGRVLLIVMTLVIHVIGLLLIDARVERVQNGVRRYSHLIVFVATIGAMGLLATALHGIEGVIWAAAYRLLGALPDYHEAVLYSLSAITTYGHAKFGFGEALAAHGGARGVERVAVVWSDYSLYVRHHPADVEATPT